MLLICSYFLRDLSLNVLINMVLIKQIACTRSISHVREGRGSVTKKRMERRTDRVTYRVACTRLKIRFDLKSKQDS